MDASTRDRIVAEIRAQSVIIGDREKLPCARAFAIAEALGVGRREIGAVCNEEGISISSCQFGCFS